MKRRRRRRNEKTTYLRCSRKKEGEIVMCSQDGKRDEEKNRTLEYMEGAWECACGKSNTEYAKRQIHPAHATLTAVIYHFHWP